jgi:uncharacterized protein (DUF1778 family)
MTRKIIAISVSEKDFDTLKKAKDEEKRSMSSFLYSAGVEKAKEVLSRGQKIENAY